MIDTSLALHTSVIDLMELTSSQLDDIRLALRSVLERQRQGE